MDKQTITYHEGAYLLTISTDIDCSRQIVTETNEERHLDICGTVPFGECRRSERGSALPSQQPIRETPKPEQAVVG